MTNVVTLELTGDETSLERAIESATRQVQTFDSAVATAGSSVETNSGKMEKMAERADRVATSTGTLSGALGAMASGLVLLGIESDSLTAKIVGGLSVGFATVQGVADVTRLAMESQKVALVASKVATIASTAATGVATGAQWAWNAALSANPIGLVIIAVLALVAVIVVIATKTDWFQRAWSASWGAIKTAAGAVATFFVDTVWHGGIEKAINWIVGGVSTVQDWMSGLPGKISSAFSGLFNIITSPFRSAFNFVADAWNGTIGKLSWSVPSWVPGIGGNSISVPKLPHYHTGGMVTGGPEGTEVLAVVQVGERVQTREMQRAESGRGGTTHIYVTVQGLTELQEFLDWQENLRNEGRGGEEVDE